MINKFICLTAMTICATIGSGCHNDNAIASVSALEFNKEITAGTAQLLDVRTPQEYAEAHINGAVNINVQSDNFGKEAEKELSKDSAILVYCRSGRRSMDAAETLAALGYEVVNLKGGIIEWQDEGLPVVAAEAPGQSAEQ